MEEGVRALVKLWK